MKTILLLAALAANTTFPGRLAGTWEGEGTAFGAPSKIEMRWEVILSGKFVALTYRNQGKQIFEGHAVYQELAGGKCKGWWFDSRGMSMPIDATFDGTLLTSQWGSPETETGRTTYRLIDESQLEVIDAVRMKDGSWKEFARATLKRRT